MKILVCGGRKFQGKTFLWQALDRLASTYPLDEITIIHGGARGADAFADEWARSKGVKTHVFFADWDKYGNAAGPIRNTKMLVKGEPDIVVAAPGGPGTADMVAKAENAGLEIIRVGRVQKL